MFAGGHHRQMPATWSLSRTKLPQKRKTFSGEGVISGVAPRGRTARVFVVRTTRPKTSLTRLIFRLEGYLTAGTSDFGEAKTWLAANPLDLLVTDVRLGRYNGLHLIIWARARHPGMRSVLIDTLPDQVMIEGASANHAAYVVNPRRTQLLAATARVLD